MAGTRFHETKGGVIVDKFTGSTVATVAIAELDTATALRITNLVIDALHREFGPAHLVNVVPDRG
ncbi:hypothetical protein RM190_08430 [Paracoccus sp. CPCC 101403]|uniref:Transposase n=1 Tax=Paracoccus broussonetiae TaxID=3075834 RepID=A0ABU3ECD3_9RHOB|nr:hypothetical protein [Paracoccus sp. CPCC 101403]MDT1061879.1 hypothetical protein [Paracoccus sp. CPCC 101403]